MKSQKQVQDILNQQIFKNQDDSVEENIEVDNILVNKENLGKMLDEEINHE